MLTLRKTLFFLEKYRKPCLFLLLIFILVFPYLLRYLEGNFTLIGSASYFHLNQAESFKKINFYQNPYHFFLSFVFEGFVFEGEPFLYQIISLVLALFSLFFLFNLSEKLRIEPLTQFFFLLFLVLSPPFIYTFTTLNHHSFFIFLSLFGFVLFFQKRKFFSFLALPLFFIVSFFDLFSSLLVFSLLCLLFFRRRNLALPYPFLILFSAILVGGSTFLSIFLKKYFLQLPGKQILLLGPYFPQSFFIDFFSDLGGLFGLSFFAFLLALINFFSPEKKEKVPEVYFFFFVFLLLSFYQTSFLIYLNFFVVLFASFGFLYLLHRNWQLNLVKKASLFLLLLGLIFSTLTYLNNLSVFSPSKEVKESLLWFKDAVKKEPAPFFVFASPQDSYLIEYFSKKPAFIHYHDPDFKDKFNLTTFLFQSSYIKDTFPLLEQNNLSYIYLSPQTKAGLPVDQGLLFLFRNERFKRIYNQNNVEIWEFRKEP